MLAAASVIGAGITLVAPLVAIDGMLLVAAGFGLLAITVAGWSTDVWRRGAFLAGVAACVPGALWAGSIAVTAVIAPLAWLGQAWTGDASASARDVLAGPTAGAPLAIGWSVVEVLVTTALAAVVAGTTACSRRRLLPVATAGTVAVAGLALAGAAVPLAANLRAGSTSVVLVVMSCAGIVASAWLGRHDADRTRRWAAFVVVPAVPAVGWAAITIAASITALVVALVATLFAVWIGRAEPVRSVHLAAAGAIAIALVGVVVAAAGSSPEAAGFAVATAAVVVAVAGALGPWRSPATSPLQLVGAGGFAIGAALARPDLAWLAGALTAAVPLLTLATIRAYRRTAYGVAAASAALGATWSWLAVAGIALVEAYTMPAALTALVIGEFVYATRRGRSLLTLGPALLLALGPTLALAVRDDDGTRALIVGSVAFLCVLVGAWRRLQAPLVLGAAALVILGVDTLGPAARDLPRWMLLAVPGVVLLWIGATFERRRDAVRRATNRFLELG